MGKGRRRALSALLGLTLLCGCRSEPNPAVAPLPVDTTPATTTAFAEQVTTISTLEAVEAVQLAAQAGGRIKELRIRQGDRVRAGELLLVLDQAQLQAELTSLRAALAKDWPNYQRHEYLVRAGAASAIERDELAQAVVASTAKLKQREADLAFRDLRSPIDGTISDVRVKAGQYESVSDPLIILMTVPTAMLGALLFLTLRQEVLNIYAQVGLVMLIGLAAKNGILIVDLANQRLDEGCTPLEAAREAAISRFRPILMTAISSLFGFLPLVLASGAGARSQASLGTVVFGGLTVATVLSLLVVPAFYVVLKQLTAAAPAPEQPV
ncbi:MAG: efflux RND transporter permease subunit [Cyanobium sp.]